MTHQEFASQLSQQMATVVGALVDASATVSPSTGGTAAAGARWVATLDAGDGVETACTVSFDDAGVVALTAITSGLDAPPPEAMILDTLREIVAQSLGAMVPHDEALGVTPRIVQLTRLLAGTPDPVSADRTSVMIAASTLTMPLVVTITGSVDPARVAAAAVAAAFGSSGASSASADRIDVILDIELPLVVRFGRTEMPLRSLARMGPGSLIDLGRSADDPVELLVSNRVVARGEVVVVGGNYGVRVLDVVSPRNRVRSMEV